MNDLHKAEAAAREAARRAKEAPSIHTANRCHHALDDLLAALDAARDEAVAWALPKALAETRADGFTVVRAGHQHHSDGSYCVPLYTAPPAAAEPADNVTPMRQPRADLARLVESINAAVYANGDGLSVTEAIGALELAKLELLKEQKQ